MVEKVLITGGAGFIGSHVVDGLIARGHEVVVLDNLSAGSLRNIERHLGKSDLSFVRGDVRDERTVRDVISGVEAVVHEAAITSVPLSVKKPSLVREVNVRGTLNLLDASSNAGVERFVYVSSCAVYGEQTRLPVAEDAPLKPISPYAESKAEAEAHCQEFHEAHGLGTVVLRYFNVYGPRQAKGEYAGVMVKFFERVREGKSPIIYGDGEQTRDFVHVKDAVDATLLALKNRRALGEVLNIGTGRATTIKELCEMFLEGMGRPELEPIYRRAKPGDIRHSRADISRARKVLGYRPRVSLELGVKGLLREWLR